MSEANSFIAEVATRGYSVIDVPSALACESFLRTMGRTFRKVEVRVTGSGRMLSSSDAMSVHTDHPDADLVAWYCIEQSDEGGASLLVDFEQMRHSLDEATLRALQRVRIVVQPLDPRHSPTLTHMISSRGLCYAEWLIWQDDSSINSVALEKFKRALEQQPEIRIRLKPGQLLVINNRRMLHGREQIRGTSKSRCLIRHWIARDEGAQSLLGMGRDIQRRAAAVP